VDINRTHRLVLKFVTPFARLAELHTVFKTEERDMKEEWHVAKERETVGTRDLIEMSMSWDKNVSFKHRCESKKTEVQ